MWPSQNELYEVAAYVAESKKLCYALLFVFKAPFFGYQIVLATYKWIIIILNSINSSWDTTQESLFAYFSRYGEVIDCVVMKNSNTNRLRTNELEDCYRHFTPFSTVFLLIVSAEYPKYLQKIGPKFGLKTPTCLPALI